MKKRNFIRNIIIFSLFTGLFACTPTLKEESISALNPAGISENWKLKNATAGDDFILLENTASSLISKFRVKNFQLKMKLQTTDGAEGKLYFHTSESGSPSSKGYSVHINNNDYRSGSAEKTGSLSRIRNFFIRMADDEEWLELDVVVRGNHILTSVNGKVVSEYFEPENPVRLPGLEKMVLSDGKIILEKSGNTGNIMVSEIHIEALSEDIARRSPDFETTDKVAEQLTLLNQEGFPIIDFHGHLKGSLTMDQVTQYGRNHGFNYGIAANCGLNFPVTDDISLNEFYYEILAEPVFKVMQCEGREWIGLFSPEYIEQFDYIFTDAMTFTDHKGRRMRLWIPEEVYVEDEEQFMDMLVEKTLAILSQEPVDIYVNPTFLPDTIARHYNRLWTNERMDPVISALVANDVALEINARYHLPGMDFIKKAKEAGVKFTFGTNNLSADDLGRLEYCIEAVREAGLTPEDMFLPKPTGRKKIRFMGLPDKVTG